MPRYLPINKSQHKYVVGIDFGHAETSAAVCEIEWDVEGGLRESKVLDIDLNIQAREKVITSAICRTDDGVLIGGESFENLDANHGIRLGFKAKPQDANGEQERLMVDYMRTVYQRIRKSLSSILTDNNHVVYIARPSGWNDDRSKELYSQMAMNAKIPLAGLTAESRAAIYYALKWPPIGFKKEITDGAIVFDLGSSTLDLTYLSDHVQPVDYGYNLGASMIDEVVFDKIRDDNPVLHSFLVRYPVYRDAILYEARKFKEKAYGRDPNRPTRDSFLIGTCCENHEEAYNDYGDEIIKMRIKNLAELNDIISKSIQYQEQIENALIDFKEKHIPKYQVTGVLLTGGASRMNFLRPIVSKVFRLTDSKVKIDPDNPSLTISRGIAMLGTADALTTGLVDSLRNQMELKLKEESFHNDVTSDLSKGIAEAAWDVIKKAGEDWVANGKTTDNDELVKKVQSELSTFMYSDELIPVINKTLENCAKKKCEDFRKALNDVISVYSPGREISDNFSIDNDKSMNVINALKSAQDSIAKACADLKNNDWIRHLLAGFIAFFLSILGGLIFDLIFAPSDEDKRRKKVNALFGKRNDICREMTNKIEYSLKSSPHFESHIDTAFRQFFTEYIETNLNNVMIPIE